MHQVEILILSNNKMENSFLKTLELGPVMHKAHKGHTQKCSGMFSTQWMLQDLTPAKSVLDYLFS